VRQGIQKSWDLPFFLVVLLSLPASIFVHVVFLVTVVVGKAVWKEYDGRERESGVEYGFVGGLLGGAAAINASVGAASFSAVEGGLANVKQSDFASRMGIIFSVAC